MNVAHPALPDQPSVGVRSRLNGFFVVGGADMLFSGIRSPVIVLTIVSALASANAAAEELESRPYRVLVSVAFDNDVSLSEAYRRTVLRNLAEAIDYGYGSMWDARIVENGWLSPASRRGVERLTLDGISRRVNASRWDKVFLMTISTVGARYDVCGRQWDVTTRSIGRSLSAATHERADVAGTAGEVVAWLFQPILSVERVEGKTVILRVQAGRYTPADRNAAQIQPGDLIQPFFRYLDDKLVVQRIQFLPWSYLIADTVDGGRVKCRLVSGLRSPLGGGRRRSVEMMAMRIRPRFASTRLRLLPANNQGKPLAGYNVDVVAKRYANDEAKGETLKLVTDRQGLVEVPRTNGGPLVWLYIRSGKLLLSRVPFVPGLVEAASIELPDDSIRLAVEGATDLLTNRLVDTVARRAVLMARARILARAGGLEERRETIGTAQTVCRALKTTKTN